jgi:hypothetical protein
MLATVHIYSLSKQTFSKKNSLTNAFHKCGVCHNIWAQTWEKEQLLMGCKQNHTAMFVWHKKTQKEIIYDLFLSSLIM